MEPGSPQHPHPNPSSGGAAQQPTTQLPRVDPPTGPPGGPPVDPPTGGSGDGGGNSKKWVIISLVAVLVAALAVGGFVLFNKSDDTDSAAGDGEVFLTAAADPGRDPFSSASFAATPDPAIATAATGATPTGTGTATASTGDQPGLYGGTNNLTVCDADKMATFLKANPDKANAWVEALNADPNLRADGGALTTANIPAYLATLTPIVLVSDTRVTNHGFANGSPTRLQSILQRGTAVFVDKYGVPRVRCACGNPLTPPKATKSTPKYQGKTWTNFSLTKVGVVQPATTPQTSFQILVPATPGSSFKRLPLGPFACVTTPGTFCKTPSGAVKKSPTGIPGNPTSSSSSAASSTPASSPATSQSSQQSSSQAPPSSTSPPSSSASGTATTVPETTLAGTVSFVATKRATDTYFQLKFEGYSPNSKVTFTCTDSKGTYGPFKVKMDASGNNTSGEANCFSSTGTITVKDRVGGSFTP